MFALFDFGFGAEVFNINCSGRCEVVGKPEYDFLNLQFPPNRYTSKVIRKSLMRSYFMLSCIFTYNVDSESLVLKKKKELVFFTFKFVL